MSLTGIRTGTDVRIAAKFQTAQGTPQTSFVNADLLRVVDAPGVSPELEVVAQQGTTGSMYELDTADIVSETPTVEAELKAGPENIKLMAESFLGVVPTSSAGGVGTIFEFEGFNGQIPDDKFLTWLWGDKFESVRAEDVWIHALRFTSNAKDSMHLGVSGVGKKTTKLGTDALSALNLVNLEQYSHKQSVFFDELNPTPELQIALIGFELNIEQDVGVINANSVAPTFVHKDGRIMVKGTLTGRLYDDTAPWIDRILALTRATYRGTWVTKTGRTLEIILRNVVLTGDITPRVSEDGRMDDFSVEFTARQTGASTFPFTLRVEV